MRSVKATLGVSVATTGAAGKVGSKKNLPRNEQSLLFFISLKVWGFSAGALWGLLKIQGTHTVSNPTSDQLQSAKGAQMS